MSTENQAPTWNDPAIRYFKKETLVNAAGNIKMQGLNLTSNLKPIPNKHFLYPLCNSPRRKEAYKDIMTNYKHELMKQISQK